MSLDCYKGDLTWATRNRVYGGGNTIDKQRYGAKQTSYELTVRKFRHFARSLEVVLDERCVRLLWPPRHSVSLTAMVFRTKVPVDWTNGLLLCFKPLCHDWVLGKPEEGYASMLTRAISFVLAILTLGPSLRANEIEGTITIQRRLTRRRVTSSADLYQRGVTVELGSDREQDPLAFERSRVVIYLEGHLPSEKITAELNQQDRRFSPDLVVIPVGSSVSFANLDPIFHNVFSLSKARSFDLGNYPKDRTRIVTFPKAGIVFVDCHLHPNMSAVIVVTPNRWGTKADASGRFVLPGVPPGTYTIVAWHRAAGFFRKTLRVTEATGVTVDFTIPLDADGVVEQAKR